MSLVDLDPALRAETTSTPSEIDDTLRQRLVGILDKGMAVFDKLVFPPMQKGGHVDQNRPLTLYDIAQGMGRFAGNDRARFIPPRLNGAIQLPGNVTAAFMSDRYSTKVCHAGALTITESGGEVFEIRRHGARHSDKGDLLRIGQPLRSVRFSTQDESSPTRFTSLVTEFDRSPPAEPLSIKTSFATPRPTFEDPEAMFYGHIPGHAEVFALQVDIALDNLQSDLHI